MMKQGTICQRSAVSGQRSAVSGQRSITLPFFACQEENYTKIRGVFCPYYCGRDAPLLAFRFTE